jgi:hypothetical protein
MITSVVQHYREAPLTFPAEGLILVSAFWWSVSETFFALSLCAAAGWAIVSLRRRPFQAVWLARITAISLYGALVLALLGSVGSLIPTIIMTSRLADATGAIVNVIDYSVAFFAYRICSISARLGLGIGLLGLFASSGRWRSGGWLLVRLQALWSLVLYSALLLDVYLDSTLPELMDGPLVFLWISGWLLLCGHAIVTRALHPAPRA